MCLVSIHAAGKVSVWSFFVLMWAMVQSGPRVQMDKYFGPQVGRPNYNFTGLGVVFCPHKKRRVLQI